MSISYFDIFPDAKLNIKTKTRGNQSFEAYPNQIHDIICDLIIGGFNIDWVTIEHSSLCHHVFLITFEGLDNSRYTLYKNNLEEFEKLSENGFPVIVLAKEKFGQIIPGVNSVIGIQSKKYERKKYKNFEEMIMNLKDRYDNGYPIKIGTELPKINRRLRFTNYGMEELTEKELQEYWELPDKVEGTYDVIGIDCEMVTTKNGSELARISCVNENGETILNELFKPNSDVIDYHTKFSGITEEILNKATSKFEDLKTILSKIADKHTIIVGHSLENDLRAMKLIHDRVVDTALIYNTDCRFPFKPGLSKLYSKYIKKPFRENENNEHDSNEDARAAMELAKYIITISNKNSDPEKEVKKLPKLLNDIIPTIAEALIFTSPSLCPYSDIDPKVVTTIKENDEEILNEFLKSSTTELPRFICINFSGLSRCDLKDEEKETIKYNEILKSILKVIPKNSALIIYTGNGNLKRIANESDKMAEKQMCKQGLLWIKCVN